MNQFLIITRFGEMPNADSSDKNLDIRRLKTSKLLIVSKVVCSSIRQTALNN